MSRSTEMVLFYTPDTTARTTRLKGIFVRLGIRIRKAGLPKIELKAVVTPTNAQWPFYKLYEEIREERRQVLEQAGKRREAREDHGETV